MSVFLSFTHMLFVALGVGGGFANLILALWLRDKPMETKVALGPFMARMARISFVSLVFLWISGMGMVHVVYDGFAAMPAAFWIKLVGVSALTVLSAGAQLVAIGVLPASLMAAPSRRFKVSVTASALSLFILMFAAIAFG